MSTRNKLLERIVLALGGTVTNPNNRNQLLYDWLTALGGPVPPTRLAPNFNGVSQSGSFSASLVSGDLIHVSFIASTSARQGDSLLGRDSGLRLLWVTDSVRAVSLSGAVSSATLDGNAIINGVTPWPDDNLEHVISISMGSSVNLNAVGASGGGSGNFASLTIYNLKINDGSVYNFPMDDGWANNPTMRNTGSGANGAFVNMTEAAWVEVPA